MSIIVGIGGHILTEVSVLGKKMSDLLDCMCVHVRVIGS
jgi:hypothetical protein